MYQFLINHQPITMEEDRNLLEYMRDCLDIISVKNGCMEGACMF